MAGISITYCPPPPDSGDACVTVIAPRETSEFPAYIINRATVSGRGAMLAVDLRDCPNLWESGELTALAEVLELARMFPEVPHTRSVRSR